MRSLYEAWISLFLIKTHYRSERRRRRPWPFDTQYSANRGSSRLRVRHFSSIILLKESHNNHNVNDNVSDDGNDPSSSSSFYTFVQYLQSSSLSTNIQKSILFDVKHIGFTNSEELIEFSLDFVDRPESLSQVLQTDFGLTALRSHQVRSTLMRMVKDSMAMKTLYNNNNNHHHQSQESSFHSVNKVQIINKNHTNPIVTNLFPFETKTSENSKDLQQPLFKTVVVNKKAKKRHEQQQQQQSLKSMSYNHNMNTEKEDAYNYGIHPVDLMVLSPILAKELQDFFIYMTQPHTHSQEPPIRTSTAQVYIRHAKLFIGWWIHYQQQQQQQQDHLLNAKSMNMMIMDTHNHTSTNTTTTIPLSLRYIFPNADASSAKPIVAFILWLRHERNVSHSYEANMLRGLTKMMKFRFIHESNADPTYGEKSFQDIPLIRELRKLHREANKKQGLSPRSSDENMKWITWLEYLQVVNALKDDLMKEIQVYNKTNTQEETIIHDERIRRNEIDSKKEEQMIITHPKNTMTVTAQQRRIATKYQYYLIVAIFSCVPDRQRTIRELELGRTLYRDDNVGCWIIKHGPEDYKTGGTYGDRPPLVLASELTSSMDDFLQRWRRYLSPTSSYFFAQIRTGQPLTQDSVYNIVARSCYKYTGKKTNPHLLRDMIVTHIRNSQASERELEALALYMGHSISMQRSSYDRRTMQQKVAPAIELLRSVNHLGESKS